MELDFNDFLGVLVVILIAVMGYVNNRINRLEDKQTAINDKTHSRIEEKITEIRLESNAKIDVMSSDVKELSKTINTFLITLQNNKL